VTDFSLITQQSPNFAALVHARMADPTALYLESDDGRRFSYQDYWDLAGRLAQALRDAGVEQGDRVAAQVGKSVEGLALLLACARLGAIFLPLNTAYTAHEVDYFIGDAEPRVLIVDPNAFDVLQPVAARHGVAQVLTLDDAGGGSLAEMARHGAADFADAAVAWGDGLAILYTSGTTGKSKGALLSHGNIASNALTLVSAWQFTPRDVLIHALPIYHTHGLFVASTTVLLSGGALLFRRKFDVDDILALMPRATCLMGVPTFYTRLLASPRLTPAATQGMRLFISGSAPLLSETHRAFAQRTGQMILERYGMTETNMNTSNPYAGARKAGTVGLPLPGISVRVVDVQSGAPLPAGEIGMIEVKGPNVFQGYWRKPEKTAEDMKPDGYFITGDLGSFDDAGYLTISGRGKDLVISGGFNVYPKEVESELDAVAGVVESAVIGLPHPDLGEAVTGLVVMRTGQAALDERTVINGLRGRLAAYKLPKRIVVVAELPRNAMGKVQKADLRKAYAGLYQPPQP
jgi:malonyl-CoA/methylmalonyl-CoA synthetase